MLQEITAPQTFQEKAGAAVFLSEIISALSFALDLTEGAVAGHALRSCLLGMRIGAKVGLPETLMRDLYYALLLKDVGCSSNAARMCQIIGGDDRAMKAGVKLEDWTSLHKPKASTLRLLWNNVLPEANAAQRLARIGKIALTQHVNNGAMITLRCDRGASIVRKLGMSLEVADAVRYLDEHWDGSGYPERRVGDAIPLLSRICLTAQNLDVFATEQGPAAAINVLQERGGRWFDPELVRVATSLHHEEDLWEDCGPGADSQHTREAVVSLAPASEESLGASQIDTLCEAFADVVDAKSPFTYRHSLGVADAATDIAEKLGLPSERRQLVRRAALLHDLGKLSVSNSILDKPGKLTDSEWLVMCGHPKLSRDILGRISAFQEIASIAGDHHERLDGTGYPDKRSASVLSLESRIIAAADVYAALAEDRPYRAGMDLDQIVSIMGRSRSTHLDAECVDAVLRYALSRAPQAA